MGWNSWNKFACNGLNEKVVRATADTMAANGMKDAGYQYVILDDCWQSPITATSTGRDAQGNIIPDPERFPSGIKALADYIHSKGLKFGIYTDVGTKTCAGRSGSVGHEYQDARQYAAWGVDYLKEDWCSTLPGQSAESSYTLMRDALAAAAAGTGHPILFSLCEWGSNKPWLWAGPVGNMWRSTPDIQDCWDCKRPWGGNGVVRDPRPARSPLLLRRPRPLERSRHARGRQRRHDHRGVPHPLQPVGAARRPAARRQRHRQHERRHPLHPAQQGRHRHRPGPHGHPGPPRLPVQRQSPGHDGQEVWSKQLADGGRAVILFNRGAAPASITAHWTDLGYPDTLKASVRDLWAHQDLAPTTGSYTAQVPSHGVVMLRIKP